MKLKAEITKECIEHLKNQQGFDAVAKIEDILIQELKNSMWNEKKLLFQKLRKDKLKQIL